MRSSFQISAVAMAGVAYAVISPFRLHTETSCPRGCDAGGGAGEGRGYGGSPAWGRSEHPRHRHGGPPVPNRGGACPITPAELVSPKVLAAPPGAPRPGPGG